VGFLALTIGVSACSSGGGSNIVNRGTTLRGLSVRLEVGAPRANGDRIDVFAYFLVKNATSHSISYAGCPFSGFKFGLLPASHPNGPLLGTSESSCGGGTTTLPAGASRKWFATSFPIGHGSRRLPAGQYVAVIRFSPQAEVRAGVELAA
jgi:hypothetical protein